MPELEEVGVKVVGVGVGIAEQKVIKRLAGTRTIGPLKLKTIGNILVGLFETGVGLAYTRGRVRDVLTLAGVTEIVTEVAEEVAPTVATFRAPVIRSVVPQAPAPVQAPQVRPTGIPGELEVTA